jgi:hypothetical protein
MPVITEVLQRLTDWLGAQQLEPQPREIAMSTLLPAAAYPQLAVLVREERYAPGRDDVTAELVIRVSCAAGRPTEALRQVRQLAHQLRTALNASHQLGGGVKLLWCHTISYGVADRRVQAGVIATAEIELEAKYCVQPLAADD